jgi:hypothetical protein
MRNNFYLVTTHSCISLVQETSRMTPFLSLPNCVYGGGVLKHKKRILYNPSLPITKEHLSYLLQIFYKAGSSNPVACDTAVACIQTVAGFLAVAGVL